MFTVDHLSKQYGAEFALNDISLTIGRGMNFIVGASGSGKTTLLKILSGMEGGYAGSAAYCGRDLASFTGAEKSALYHAVFGFVWQDFHLLEEASVLENILLPQYLEDGRTKSSAAKLLKQLKLEDLRDKKVKFLSGGQKQRVAIARELMKNPQVIFCDEPTSALDAKSARTTMDILRDLARSRTVIVVTHDTSLMAPGDRVYELDKGELVCAPEAGGSAPAYTAPRKGTLSPAKALRLAWINTKNRLGRFAVSALTLLVAGVLLLTTVSGAIGESGQSEFEKLLDTYGPGILDIGLVGSFMSAAGGDADKPNADVTQDLSGLYERYENDERVEFLVNMQPFENIVVTLDGETHAVEKTGSAPVLTELVAGSIPGGEEMQVVVPLKLVEDLGLEPEEALGKEIDFSATVYQWVNDQPVERPVQIRAAICGVADNTVVYDYQGQPYSFTVDDSFFFNRAANEELRRQGGIDGKSANFTLRAKTPEDLIALKDELNRMGIVPMGWFELVEDMVRLGRQTAEQSGSASAVIGVLAVLLVAAVFAMTAALRRREYAICKVSGYRSGQLAAVLAGETLFAAAAAVVLLAAASPLLDGVTRALFGASIRSAAKLAAGAGLTLAAAVAAFAAGLPGICAASVSAMLKEGSKA